MDDEATPARVQTYVFPGCCSRARTHQGPVEDAQANEDFVTCRASHPQPRPTILDTFEALGRARRPHAGAERWLAG